MTDLGPMYNPPHPGEFITEVYLKPSGMSSRRLAGKLGVTPSTLQRLLQGSHRVSPEMAMRLSVVLGRSARSWLSMQASYDLWQLSRDFEPVGLERLDFSQAS
jgi:addiction module HigA family antidote